MGDPNRPPAGNEPDSSLSGAETAWAGPSGGAPGPQAPPEWIGAYRVERRLGRGGMGEVFLARDERLERWVAVKRIRHDAGLPPILHERFRREARTAARLSHPAIVQIHDLVSDETGDAIVLEYVEGVTLAERLAAGPLPAADAVRLGRQLAEGLAAAHAAGVIHRDLKAENVIVTPAGQAKILDFGLARPLEDKSGLTQQGMLVGTYHAMSPEQASGREVDARSDLFSLGALLYEMLTGRAPFRAASAAETLKKVVAENPPPLRAVRPELPADLAYLLNRLLAKDREARPRSAGEVALALARIEARGRADPAVDSVSDLPTGPMPSATEPDVPPGLPPTGTTPSSTVGLSLRGRRWPRIAAALAVSAAFAAGAVLILDRAPDRVIRVIAARPEIVPAPADPQLELAASAVLSSALGLLASLDGVAPIDPGEAGVAGGSPLEMARAAGADEVLAAALEQGEGTLARVSLRRIQGSEQRVLWSETFTIPVDRESLRLLADAVAAHLRRAYPDRRLRPGAPDLEVRDADYAAFLEVKGRVDAGTAALAPELARLEGIAESSPRFLEAHLLAARTAVSLFHTGSGPSYLDRALRLARQAEELAPNDPRPLSLELQIAIAQGREEDAEAIRATLERLLPGDPEVLLPRQLRPVSGPPGERRRGRDREGET